MLPLDVLTSEETLGTLLLGVGLILGVLAFGWFEYRRTSKLPNLGTVMVKNRLKGSD